MVPVNERHAWGRLEFYASRAGVAFKQSTPLNQLRRSLAKTYQPRKATDDDAAMREINGCIDYLDDVLTRRELCGVPDVNVAARPAAGQPLWQTDPTDDSQIRQKDYSDLNYIRYQIYDRSVRFGDVSLVKAWAWDGDRFQKVIAVRANSFANEELGRALLYYQSHGPVPTSCDAIFLTAGEGRVKSFRLLLYRWGRACEDVSKYELDFTVPPDAPDFARRMRTWLSEVEEKLVADRS